MKARPAKTLPTTAAIPAAGPRFKDGAAFGAGLLGAVGSDPSPVKTWLLVVALAMLVADMVELVVLFTLVGFSAPQGWF